jgi:hypothetical protein
MRRIVVVVVVVVVLVLVVLVVVVVVVVRVSFETVSLLIHSPRSGIGNHSSPCAPFVATDN